MSTPTPAPPIVTAVEPNAEPAQPVLSEPARLINTFAAPSKTFEDIRRNASWWVPWLLISIVSTAFWVVVDKKIGFDQIAQKFIANSKQLQAQPPDQQVHIAANIATFTKFSSYASPLFTLFFALITAVVLRGTFNLLMASEVSFGRSMAIVMYGWLPGSLLFSILSMLAVWLGDPEGFRLESPVGTNPGYYMDPHTTSKFLSVALSSFDVLGLWMVALVGIGFALNAKKKLKMGTAIGTVAAWYFFAKLIGAAFAGMGR
jgi:Yip1 domain